MAIDKKKLIKRTGTFFVLFFGIVLLGVIINYQRGYVSGVFFPLWSPPKEIYYPNTLDVKFDDCKILLPVYVNGKIANFIFDPSKTHSAISTKFSKKLAWSFAIPALGGMALVDNLKIGNLLFKDLRMLVSEVSDPELPKNSSEIDGILGADFLIHVRVTIDFKKKQILFDVPNTNLFYTKDGSAKLIYSFRNLMPKIKISYGGKKLFAVLDFRNFSHLMKIDTDNPELLKELPQELLIGGKKVNGKVDQVKKNPLDMLREVQSVLGCELFVNFEKFTIDLKQGYVSYQLLK